MGYILGSFVALTGGGYAMANERPGTVGGNLSVDLYVQLYDANHQAIGAAIVVGQAFSDPNSGRYSTIVGFDLVAAPLGGVDVVYTGERRAGSSAPTFNFMSGVMFDAHGDVAHYFGYDYTPSALTAPHITPLVNGGAIVDQDRSAWFYDPQGTWLSGMGSPTTGEFHDLGSIISQLTTRTDGTVDQWLIGLDGMIISTAIVKTVTGTSGDDVLVGSTGPDIIVGGAGNDTITGGFGYDTLTGGSGADRFYFGLNGSIDRVTDFDPTQDMFQITDLQAGALPTMSAGTITFDTRTHILYWDDDGAAGPHQPIAVAVLDGASHIGLSNIMDVKPALLVNIVGLGAYDVVGSGNITGGAMGDTLTGGDGNDTLTGGGGNDKIDGGAGTDTAVFSGARSDYSWVQSAAGVITITDNRSGSPDGVDTLTHVEILKFKDQQVALGPATAADALTIGLPSVLRETTPTAADTVWRDGLLAQPGLTAAGAVSAIVSHAAATTSVATLAYQFFTGKTPGAAGMDYLVSPTGANLNNLNSAYYQSFNLENRYINFAMNLGKNGEGRDSFQAVFGSLSLHDATKLAYQKIFGAAPTDAQVDVLLTPARADYFAYYGQDGANGIGTKAAMVGWLLAEAVKADVGVYAQSNDALLADVALHRAPFGVDLVGVYSQPSFTFHPA